MSSSYFLSGIALSALVVLGAGCASNTTTSGSSTPGVSVAQASQCENPYFPLKAGYKVSYASQAGSLASRYTMEVTDVRPMEAHLKYTVGDAHVEHRLKCDNGAISELQYLDLGSAMGGQAQAVTRNVRGVLLPADLHVGSDWTTSFDITLNSNATGSNALHMDGSVTTRRKAIGEEDVTVEAGTFRALKVTGDMKMHFTTTLPTGQNLPDVSILTTEWWVPGKGLVKTDSRTNTLVGGFTSQATEIVTP